MLTARLQDEGTEAVPRGAATGSGVVLVRAEDRTVLHVNRAYARISGRDAQELVGRPLADLHPPGAAVAAVLDEMAAALSSTGSWEGQTLELRAGGTPLPCTTVATCIEHRRLGTVWALAKTPVAEAPGSADAESEVRFHAAVETMADAFGIFTAVRDSRGEIVDFRVEYVNEEACRSLGLVRRPIEGTCVLQESPGFPPELFRSACELVESGGRDGVADLTYASAATGFHYEVRARALRDGFTATWRDVTERVLLERELRRSNAQLEHFARAASHDLAAPLRTMRGLAEELERTHADALGGEGLRAVRAIRSSGARLQELIDGLLASSRAGHDVPRRVAVDLSRVVDDVLDDLEEQVRRTGAQIDVGPLPVVQGDPVELRQLLQNLIDNAIKFARPGARPHVDVRAARRVDGTWSVTVADDGIGIPPTGVSRVFHMFERLDVGEEVPGTGIGLPTCRRIVERHGGRIWVEPAAGGGTALRFTLASGMRPATEGDAP